MTLEDLLKPKSLDPMKSLTQSEVDLFNLRIADQQPFAAKTHLKPITKGDKATAKGLRKSLGIG
jgi:hypothetical protein